MGYACIICHECLELPAPEYMKTKRKYKRPTAGTSTAAMASPPTQSACVRKPSKSNNIRIRDGIPTDVIVTQCGHLFHQTCIVRWSKGKSSMNCPVCMKLCKKSMLKRIFPEIISYHPDLDDEFIPPRPGKVKAKLPAGTPGPCTNNGGNNGYVQRLGVQFVSGTPIGGPSRQANSISPVSDAVFEGHQGELEMNERNPTTPQSGEKRPSENETGDGDSPAKHPRCCGNDCNHPADRDWCVVA